MKATVLAFLALVPLHLVSAEPTPTELRRAAIVATLPYQANGMLSALKQMGKTGESKGAGLIRHLLLEDLLRLDICLGDSKIPDSEKQWAKKTIKAIIEYAKETNLIGQFEEKTYDMLPNDLILPPEMNIAKEYSRILATY